MHIYIKTFRCRSQLTVSFEIQFKEPLQTEFEFLLAPKTPLTLIMRDRVY